MVPTLNTITTEIASQLKKELDEVYKRILAEKVDNWRARLIRNSLEKRPQDAKFFVQAVYIPMERISEIPECLNVPVNCPVARSIKDIPKPLRYGTVLFDFVGSANGSTVFTFAGIATEKYLSAGKYSKKSVFYSWDGAKLVVRNHPNLPLVKVQGIFENPSEIYEYNCNSGIECDGWDKPYPVTRDILQQIVQFIVEGINPPVVPNDKQVEVTPQSLLSEAK